MPRPKKLSHIFFRTSRLDEMVDWYVSATGSRIVFRSPKLCLLTFDDEHHRLGILQVPDMEPQSQQTAGFEHVGFSFATLYELLEAYVELRDRGIAPRLCTNHGPTISFYYFDPDRNHVELLFDNFEDAASAQRFVESEAFRTRPMGLSFDPEHMLRCAEAGVPLARLIAYEPLP
jgi:catechol-2,3-dioxygenase